MSPAQGHVFIFVQKGAKEMLAGCACDPLVVDKELCKLAPGGTIHKHASSQGRRHGAAFWKSTHLDWLRSS